MSSAALPISDRSVSAGTRLSRMVTPGAAIGYWQLSTIAEERFDVAPRPMQGEMDPFFFLTKTKNYIPHEYPCRKEFAARFRGKRPEVRYQASPERFWLPFGSPRVDLSGFWFRPTRLSCWARTFVRADAAGTARLRLKTCGGAILWVNGAEVATLSGYVRNLEFAAECSVALQAGENRFEVFFDDLAERDTRLYFALEYLDGPEVAVELPVPCEARDAEAIEAALNAMHFSAPSYASGSIELCLPAPLPFPADLTVDIHGDFISAHRASRSLAVPAGATRIEVGTVTEAPTGFRHFGIELSRDGFSATRALGVEIAPQQRAAPPPPDDAGRIAETLRFAADGERDATTVLARLAAGRGGNATDQMIMDLLPGINDCFDCADFALVPLLWARIAHADSIGDTARSELDRAILGFRYWMDEPGNDVQWYFSENHALLFHTAAYLAGSHFPEARFVRSQRTAAEQAGIGRERVRAWLDHFERWEMAEFNSAPYFPIDLKGLCALQALAPDSDIAKRAGRAIVRLIEIVARSAHHGILTAAQGRSYEHSLCVARTLELSGIARLLWGKGALSQPLHALPLLAICLRDHGLSVPADLAATADMQGPGSREWRFAQGENRIARLYHYKSRDFALGSAVHYRWNEWGYQETVLHARLGETPEAALFINHPGEVLHFGFARPSFWGGNGKLPRVQQYRGLAVLTYDLDPGQVEFTHAWFPRSAFDETRIRGDRAFARAGSGAAMLAASGPLEQIETGPSADVELRLAGRKSVWLMRVAEATSLDDLVERFGGLGRETASDGTIVVNDPVYGPVKFLPDGCVLAEGRRLSPDDYTIAGETRTFT